MSEPVNYEGCPPGTPIVWNAEQLWGYDMKMGGPATALSLFFLLSIILIYQLIHGRNRNTKYMSVLVLAAMAEGGGYAAAVHTVRESCKSDLFDSFLAAQVIILLVPNLIEATMYVTASKGSAFGRVPRSKFWLRPAFLTWFYTTSDIITIIIQAIGIGIWGSARTSDDEDQETYDAATAGAWVVVAGLCAQIASQTIFAFEVLYIQYKIDRNYTSRPESRALFFSVYWIWSFLQIRNIYRLVAFIMRAESADTRTGGSGAAEIQPVFFIFEPLMMVLAIATSTIFPPGYLLPKFSAREAEKIEDRHERGEDPLAVVPEDMEKGGKVATSEAGDLFVQPEVPAWMRPVLRPFEKYPWLGALFK